MDKTITASSPRKIERSLLIVNPEHPLDTLPFIRDALICMATFLQHEPALSNTGRAEVGAGLILDLMAYAIEDVQEAFEEQYKKPLNKGAS